MENGALKDKTIVWFVCMMANGGECNKFASLGPGEASPESIDGCPVLRPAPPKTPNPAREQRRRELAAAKALNGGALAHSLS
jgi:hypothetical protein